MATRVEVLNAGINRNSIRVRRVRVERRNGLSVIVDEPGEGEQIVPGNRFASKLDATAAGDGASPTMLLIEEIVPASGPAETSA